MRTLVFIDTYNLYIRLRSKVKEFDIFKDFINYMLYIKERFLYSNLDFIFVIDGYPEQKIKIYKEYKKYKIRNFVIPNFFYILVKLLNYLDNIYIILFRYEEADDIISVLMNEKELQKKWLGREYNKYIIVSNDSDYYQLFEDDISLKILNKMSIINIEYFIKFYKFSPKVFVLFKALKGDKADNIKSAVRGNLKYRNIRLGLFLKVMEKIMNIDNISVRDILDGEVMYNYIISNRDRIFKEVLEIYKKDKIFFTGKKEIRVDKLIDNIIKDRFIKNYNLIRLKRKKEELKILENKDYLILKPQKRYTLENFYWFKNLDLETKFKIKKFFQDK